MTTGEDEKPTIGQQLLGLARQRWRWGIDESGRPFAVDTNGPNVTVPLRGPGLTVRTLLSEMFSTLYDRPAPSGPMADTLASLEGLAYQCDPETVSIRVGDHRGHVVVDLADMTGRAIVVDAHGWTMHQRSPVLFRRTAAMLPMVEPTTASVDAFGRLQALLNVNPADWHLLLAWMTASFFHAIPHPILAVTGEQGTGKTSALRAVVSMIDPSSAPTRALPRSLDDWQVAASASWVVALDNLSGLDPKMSDAFCRACTGDGLVKRQLYSDSDVSVLSFRRVIAFNGIDVGTMRGDLGDRLVAIELDPIITRRTEAELDAELDRLRPAVLGDLLDLVAVVLRELPSTPTPRDLRMADFARILGALDAGTGWTTLDRYREVASSTMARLVDGDAFAIAVRDLADRHRTWTGTAAMLRNELEDDNHQHQQWLPHTPNGIAHALRRCTPSLRAAGVTIQHSRSGARGRAITISRQTVTPVSLVTHESDPIREPLTPS